MNRTVSYRLAKRISLPLLALACAGATLAACGSSSKTSNTSTNENKQNKRMGPDTLQTMSGLKFIVHEKGDEQRPVLAGMKVTVDYAGYLTDGTLFDTSIDSIGAVHNFDRGGYPFEPIEFTVGAGQVIRGWDEGLTTDMYVGGRRRLIIPAALAYGSRAVGTIPANSDLIFDIHVLSATE